MKDRTIKLLKKILNANIPISIEVLCADFRLSQRTIRNEIREINTYLEENGYALVQNQRGEGLLLKLTPVEILNLMSSLEDVSENSYLSREERLLDLLLDISLGENEVFLYKKEEEYRISKSSLDEDMRRMRTILQDYQVEIVSIPKQGLVLTGKERNVRTMLYSVLDRTIDTIVNLNNKQFFTIRQNIVLKYIPSETFVKLDQIYEKTISVNKDSLYRKNLILFTAIWISRYQRQNLIHTSFTSKHVGSLSLEVIKFVDEVCDEFQLTPEGNEINYLLSMLDTFSSKEIKNSIEWMQVQILSIRLIQYVENVTKIPFSKKEETLQEGLYQHIGGLLNRMRHDVQFANPLKENIKSSYGNIYTAVEAFSKEISKLVNKEITDDEIAFLTIHFSTCVSELNQEVDYSYRAVVICNHGIATGKLLAENLKEFFNIEVLAVLSSREIELIEKLDVDIVFSTLPIHIESKPILVIDPIIKKESKEAIESFLLQNSDSRRLISHREDSTKLFYSILNLIEQEGVKINNRLYERLETIFTENRLLVNTREIRPMIKDVLKDENIIVDAQAEGWEEAIEIVAAPLLKEEVITQQYVDAMIGAVKEYGPYIVIGKHLALAHARPEEGAKELGLSVATLREPVVFGHEDNDPVKIIFCLSAVDSFSHLSIMKNLIDLINDEQKIERLSSVTNVNQLKQLLFE